MHSNFKAIKVSLRSGELFTCITSKRKKISDRQIILVHHMLLRRSIIYSSRKSARRRSASGECQRAKQFRSLFRQRCTEHWGVAAFPAGFHLLLRGHVANLTVAPYVSSVLWHMAGMGGCCPVVNVHWHFFMLIDAGQLSDELLSEGALTVS